ncbi:MAG TPA: AraC family transcriptional regulator [Chitinophagaceae bacterium]|nr:AraC family transcriptional regulator [Chitinophagaceae bacterium]
MVKFRAATYPKDYRDCCGRARNPCVASPYITIARVSRQFPCGREGMHDPSFFDQYQLPGSKPALTRNTDAGIFRQEITIDNFTFTYVTACVKTAPLSVDCTRALIIMLEGSAESLRENHYILSPGNKGLFFTRTGLYRFAGLTCKDSVTAGFFTGPVTPAMMGHVYSLLHTPYIRTMQAFYHSTLQQLWDEAHQNKPPIHSLYSEDIIERLQETKKFIAKQLDTHYTIEMLATRARLNSQQFKQGFKALFGEGPYACLLRMRLERAKKALEETRKPVKQIAAQAGYRDQANFAIAFKRMFGVTAKEVRNKVR